MYRHVFPILLIVILLLGIFGAALNTPWLVNWYVPYFFQINNQTVDLKKFSVGRQKYTFPETLTFYDVEMVFEHRGQERQIKVKKLIWHDAMANGRLNQSRLSCYGLFMRYAPWELENTETKLFLTFSDKKIKQVEGILGAQGFKVGVYHLVNATARFRGGAKNFQLYEIMADAYGGTISGQVTVENWAKPNFVLWLECQGMAAEEMKSVNEFLFSRLKGRVNGSVRLVGQEKWLSLLAINLELKEGGTLTSSLLQDVASGLSESGRKSQALALAAAEPSLAFEKIAVFIQSTNNNRMTVTYLFDKSKTGFRLKASREIYVASGLGEIVFKGF